MAKMGNATNSVHSTATRLGNLQMLQRLAGGKTRFKITSQSATNKKKVPIATKLPLIKAFHMWLLRDLQMSLPSGRFACMCHPDVCYGFILLHNFYNMHQLFSM